MAYLCAVGAAWVIVPAQTAGWTFLGELMVHWTAHAGCLLVIPLVIWRRQRIHCLSVLVLLAFALWPWLVAAWSPRAERSADTDVTVATFNLNIDNPTPAAEIPALRACSAEVMVLIEVDAADEQSLRGDPRWPYQRWLPRGGGPWHGLGIALLSRHPVEAFVVHAVEEFPAIEARLLCAGHPLRVLAVHPMAPVSTYAWQLRNRQFDLLAGLVRDMKGPVVVLGDWNSSIADPAWRRLLATTGLRRSGGNAPATWPSLVGPFGIAIDHVVAGNGADVTALQVVAIAGSDHRGLTATIDVH